ncbi:PREDICTED: urocortin [Gekko japonicus]|uniref:Urocortin n=1 Tax=Gekko japonicus TaxID=146911 RepID=A0ABM1KAB6_GEKJA|nr:PREDICTED: urocortin [Gekko japonicus]
MRRALLPLLVASLLLLSRASARLTDFEGPGERGLSLRLKLLPLGQARRAGTRGPLLAPSSPAPGPDGAALARRPLTRAAPAGELSERLKRQEWPNSIDLTFHLLRHMLEIARLQSQQEQAEENRLVFEDLGK